MAPGVFLDWFHADLCLEVPERLRCCFRPSATAVASCAGFTRPSSVRQAKRAAR